ncbi:LLM class flavin-dependent oxidoreductase [Pseudaquabacterium rugosum]|uniref:LLM class flavin-dependent oxidoreductase n=1 Tax=Pseudaquabacterium rugosum TaxID=2984194 RepID=A0ABU9B5G1_9BURK
MPDPTTPHAHTPPRAPSPLRGPLSVLDLAPIIEGGDAADALARSTALARHAEALGYHRYWLAEHHNMDGLACSATAVLVGHIASATTRIRVGSGGVMLPNHAPLTVAEAFGTLATLYPERIDLGLGRAPGTDMATARALRRHLHAVGDDDAYLRDVQELESYLAPAEPHQRVRAIPGAGTRVPVWLLGSSLYSAQAAAWLGRPYAFASHFAPDQLDDAIALYRSTYRPSERWPKPHVMVAFNAVLADTDDEAAFHFTTLQQRFLGMVRGVRGPLPRPIAPAELETHWNPGEAAQVRRMLSVSVVGGPDSARAQLARLQERTGADEWIATCNVHGHGARLRSYEVLAGVVGMEVGRVG